MLTADLADLAQFMYVTNERDLDPGDMIFVKIRSDYELLSDPFTLLVI